MKADDLKNVAGFHYLGSPYSKYPLGMEQAHADVCELAASLIERGLAVYSPIAHTHSVAYYGDLDPLDHKIWLPADKPMMDAASTLIVAMMESWKDSYGLKFEIDVFKQAGKPIFYLNTRTLELSESPND